MEAEIKILCKDPDMVIKSIKPDIEKTKKFDIQLNSEKERIKLEVKSSSISGLLAGINSYLRLIRTAIKTMEV